MKFVGLFLCLVSLVFNTPAYAQQAQKSEIVEPVKVKEKAIALEEKPSSETETTEELSPIKRCFKEYTEEDSIGFCLKVAYEKAERKRHFTQEKMFDILVEQNFMPEEEQKRIETLKFKREALKKRKPVGHSKEQAKALAMEKVFAANDLQDILSFESKNDSERERALQMMKNADTDFEKYRETECERQRFFYISNAAFSQFVFYTCMYNLTDQRNQTLQSSLR